MKKREHQTLNTVSTALWCNKCKAETQHHVSGKRIGHCLRCAGIEQKAPELPKNTVFILPSCTCSDRRWPHTHGNEQGQVPLAWYVRKWRGSYA